MLAHVGDDVAANQHVSLIQRDNAVVGGMGENRAAAEEDARFGRRHLWVFMYRMLIFVSRWQSRAGWKSEQD